MKYHLLVGLGLLAASLSAPALAGERTVRLSVPAMHCASCPYMVRQAISAVDGVIATTANADDRTAIVTYDDVRTSIDAIQDATASIGYEATVINGEDS